MKDFPLIKGKYTPMCMRVCVGGGRLLSNSLRMGDIYTTTQLWCDHFKVWKISNFLSLDRMILSILIFLVIQFSNSITLRLCRVSLIISFYEILGWPLKGPATIKWTLREGGSQTKWPLVGGFDVRPDVTGKAPSPLRGQVHPVLAQRPEHTPLGPPDLSVAWVDVPSLAAPKE